jgi:hypothetical protein
MVRTQSPTALAAVITMLGAALIDCDPKPEPSDEPSGAEDVDE